MSEKKSIKTEDIVTISCPKVERELRRIRKMLHEYRITYARSDTEDKKLRTISMITLTVYLNLFGELALRDERAELKFPISGRKPEEVVEVVEES